MRTRIRMSIWMRIWMMGMIQMRGRKSMMLNQDFFVTLCFAWLPKHFACGGFRQAPPTYPLPNLPNLFLEF